MKRLMNIMFLSCLKATELIEKKLAFKLSITEKIQLAVHKTMCEACSNYEDQSILIDKGLHNLGGSAKIDVDMDAFKKSILDKTNHGQN
ncbi:MAG: hypothetical protein GXO88_03825 [Chlorobi bacterium]|nr:hypothetical protein [Chlorobiota bacterium]